MESASKFKGVQSIFAVRLTELIAKGKNGKKINQQELATAVGTTRQAISQYASGAIQPNAEKIYKIAEYFDVSADYLLGITSAPSKSPTIQAMSKYLGLTEKAMRILAGDAHGSNPLSNNPHSSFYYAQEENEENDNLIIKPTRGQIISLLLEDDGDGYVNDSILYLIANILSYKFNPNAYYELAQKIYRSEDESEEDDFVGTLKEVFSNKGMQEGMETLAAHYQQYIIQPIGDVDLFNLRMLALQRRLKKFKDDMDKKGIELWML